MRLYRSLMKRLYPFLIKNLERYQQYVAASAPQERGKLESALQRLIWSQTQSVEKGSDKLLFCCTNQLTAWRTSSFFEKEPETLVWLDSIPTGSCLWDIGANVGLYTIYAGKVRNCRVYAFEPSVFNLEVLTRNVHLNGLSSNVTIVPTALSDVAKEGSFELSSLEQGGACSTFAEGYDHVGEPMQTVFSYKTLSLSGDDLISLYKLPIPNYIKIDVDGIEHLVLAGMGGILRSRELKGLLVETNFDFQKQSIRIASLLESAGFIQVERAHAECFEGTQFGNTFNCIWVREALT